MVVVVCQAIIPFDFIKVLSTEMDDGHNAVIKRKPAKSPLCVVPNEATARRYQPADRI
jgi:hypothetical protein